MGQTAEILAREFEIGRSAQDLFALRSHDARQLPLPRNWRRRSCPSTILREGRPSCTTTACDSNQTLEALAKLRPVFEPETGTVTAGNSSQITDGAVALLVGTASVARELNLEPLGIIRDFAYAGCDPKRMGLGPVYAVDRLLKRLHLSLGDADLIEINEAFAAQVLAVLRELKAIGDRGNCRRKA